MFLTSQLMKGHNIMISGRSKRLAALHFYWDLGEKMTRFLKEYLFEKHIIVSGKNTEQTNPLEAVYSLYALMGVRIVSGGCFLGKDDVSFVAEMKGKNVPTPFYRGFPDSVRALSPDTLLFDQILSYINTYGFGNFEETSHSMFETLCERTNLDEDTKPEDFIVLPEEKAIEKAGEIVEDLLCGTRPLSPRSYDFLLEYCTRYHYPVTHCASKNTAVRLICDLKNTELVSMLSLSDVFKLVEMINYSNYGQTDTRCLNLSNKDRRFITKVIDILMTEKTCNTEECYEKKKFWCGLLHHIHYKPQNDTGRHFADCMRGKGNESAYSKFEKALEQEGPVKATAVLRDLKGSGAVMRNLNFILSRCKTGSEAEETVKEIATANGLMLLQLLVRFSKVQDENQRRSFRFTRFNRIMIHTENMQELERRRSIVPESVRKDVFDKIGETLRTHYYGKTGKTYIDEAMKLIALPLQESNATGGFGTLTKGSRIRLPESFGTIRAFTYWEQVDDIDLSVLGIDTDGNMTEFSWRTMAGKQSEEITYSGDETSGMNGGSEYFDINTELMHKKHPDIRYLVFCNNVFSRSTFANCICRAGYMLRQKPSSGEIYEPKTVKSAFTINADGNFAYLFAVDLTAKELIWLNCVSGANIHVAGVAQYAFLQDYFDMTSVINLYDFFKMTARETTDDPLEADLVVSDRELRLKPGAEQIRSFDVERIMKIMNE